MIFEGDIYNLVQHWIGGYGRSSKKKEYISGFLWILYYTSSWDDSPITTASCHMNKLRDLKITHHHKYLVCDPP